MNIPKGKGPLLAEDGDSTESICEPEMVRINERVARVFSMI
jgi:hypothetical protein